jgi:F-type H+-transporting ATPase subunit b
MLDIDLSFIVVFLIIWILLVVLTKLFFNPIRKKMQERDSRIQGNKQASQFTRTESEKMLAEAERALKSARIEGERIREEISRLALQERSRLIAEASAQSRKQVEKSRHELEGQIAILKESLSAEASRFAGEIERRLLD